MRVRMFFTTLLLLVSIAGVGLGQEVQVPPTDLSKETEKPGTFAHTTYQVNAQREKYPKAHPARPETDFADNVLTPFESQLASLPPEQVNLAEIPVFTNYIVLEGASVMPFESGQPRGETPDTIRAVYQVSPNGGSGTVAIVDAFNYPTAAADLKMFSDTFKIPCNDCFQIKYASGTKPQDECNWAGEAALDIEWAHAMAPSAKIILVEAQSSNMQDMLAAVDYAANLVSQAGGGQVSLSWGGREFSTEGTLDAHFVKPGVVFVASSGDVGGLATYPSESPNVISVGGTTIVRNGDQFLKETAWGGSGGGPSVFEGRPSFQTGVAHTDPLKRSAPDVSADADPFSGVAVFDSTACQGRSGWLVVGGTSLAAPLVAGMINTAKSSSTSSQQELARLYKNGGDSTKFRDIVEGKAGSYNAGPGYDFVTGSGSLLSPNFDKP